MIGSLPYLTLSLTEMEMIHQKTLDLLAHTGIYIDHDGFLTKLREAGAEVDFSTRRAVIPHDMVQSAMLSQSGPASRLHTSSERSPASLLNGVGNSRGYGEAEGSINTTGPGKASGSGKAADSGGKDLLFNFGGSALYVNTSDSLGRREAGFADFEEIVRFGNGHPRIRAVGGPPVQMVYNEQGCEIPPPLRVLSGMTYLAKHTAKPGVSEINTRRDVFYARELNNILHASGSPAAAPSAKSGEAPLYSPIEAAFLNFRCTISPLKIGFETADVLYALAETGLPIRIAPMPLAGATTPVTVASALMIANAEIIGTLTALEAVASRSPQEHLMLSGILNMKTGGAAFSAPNVMLQDIGMAQLYRHYYDIPLIAASDYIDAPAPSYQSGHERALKILASGLTGCLYPSIGQLEAGLICSPVQACLDIDAFDWTARFLKGIEVTEETLCTELIADRGIGGHFLDADHTLDNFRQEFFFARCPGPDSVSRKSMLEQAEEEVASLLEKTPVFTRQPEVIKEIESLHTHELHQRGFK